MTVRCFMLIVVLLFSSRALACSCFVHKDDESHTRQALEFANSIVLATATNVEDHFNADALVDRRIQNVRWQVLDSWQGDHSHELYTRIVLDCCRCGMSFEEGKTYLLYLYDRDGDGIYSTSICSGNLSLERAGGRIEVLDRFVPNKSLSAHAP